MQVSYSKKRREGNWYVEGSREGKWNRGKNRRQKEKGIQRKQRGKNRMLKENVEEINLKEMRRNVKEMR